MFVADLHSLLARTATSGRLRKPERDASDGQLRDELLRAVVRQHDGDSHLQRLVCCDVTLDLFMYRVDQTA